MLNRAVLVGGYPLLDLAPPEKPADQVVQRPVGTYPVAEEPAQKQRGNQDDQRPGQALVERVGGDGRGDREDSSPGMG